MRTYSWWLGRKHRVRKKYKLLLGMYYSPKELREWYKKVSGLEIRKEAIKDFKSIHLITLLSRSQ